jgi:hypothetical protein
MAKQRHRHHRNVNQSRFQTGKATTSVATEQAVAVPAATATTPNAEVVHVKRDLRTTALLTSLLVVALAVGSYLNTRMHWTLQFGDLLYRWLHIG